MRYFSMLLNMSKKLNLLETTKVFWPLVSFDITRNGSLDSPRRKGRNVG